MGPRLLLIYPGSFNGSFGDLRYIPHITGRSGLMNVSLATVAALTPAHWRVTIIDENVEPVPYDGEWDLVGITGFNTQIRVARRIAERFRALGVPVVCGGPSVSVSPERWRPFADALVIGEAEEIWAGACADFEAGAMKPEYAAPRRPELTTSPLPDYAGWSDAAKRSFFGGVVQTSRGCPFDCNFCDVIVYVGRKMRYKTPDQVVAELQQLREMGLGFAIIADDNFGASRKTAREILRAIRAWNRQTRNPMMLFTQISVDTARDTELLALASEAGLNRMLVGIESPDLAALKEANKRPNFRSDLLRDVQTFHEHGIMVIGTSMLGFDHDDLGCFRRHFDFHQTAGILTPQPYPLQAPDGTPLQAKMRAQGRYREPGEELAPEATNIYNTFTIQPAQMSIPQLRAGVLWLARELYRPENVLTRLRTFFAQFEASPVRRDLEILRPGVDRGVVRMASGLARHLVLRAPRRERRALGSALKAAAGSSHPQALQIALGTLLVMKNVQAMLRLFEPDLEAVTYPAP